MQNKIVSRCEMILHCLSDILKLNVVLGSSSPRRQQLLNQIKIAYEVIVSQFAEDLDKKLFDSPEEYVKRTAYEKLQDVKRQVEQSGKPSRMIIGADTVVVLGNKILEKPADFAHGREMLSSLSGQYHDVVSSVVILYRRSLESDWESEQFQVTTKVKLAQLSSEMIDAYLSLGESFDKSGGYAAQGIAASFIESIEGDYYNVVGLPVYPLCAHLKWIMENKMKDVN